MRVLLDTHAVLWFYLGDSQLSKKAKTVIADPINVKFVSPAMFWEIAIKLSIGKYTLNETYDEFIQHAIFDSSFIILPIQPRHTSTLVPLPWHHKDPFDRLMVAQCLVEGLSFVSKDTLLDQYGIARVW